MKQRIRLVETCSGDAMNQSGSPIHLPNNRLATKQLFPIQRLRTDSRNYFIDKWTIRPHGKTDAPSGPSKGISLRHMNFLSANGARARPWQNTDCKTNSEHNNE